MTGKQIIVTPLEHLGSAWTFRDIQTIISKQKVISKCKTTYICPFGVMRRVGETCLDLGCELVSCSDFCYVLEQRVIPKQESCKVVELVRLQQALGLLDISVIFRGELELRLTGQDIGLRMLSARSKDDLEIKVRQEG
jgi:hypothetical protein